ncbi:DUF5690 family protein [Sphingobacterium suaedae]|uniref:DUF5690 family protein n=1 Tax=Sphingobacterium suaedae TaxID=1686402 RepID=A0ABW5KIX4_9SPHI
MPYTKKLSWGLSEWNGKLIVVITAFAAFMCYTSMYAFRKSFTAAEFEDQRLFGMDYKVCLVIIQMLGYMLSKFYGIRFIAESKASGRGRSLVMLILLSWLGLFGFAVSPHPWNAFFLFLNGFPLGMIWGLVFSYLEGRKYTEFMGAVMAVSLVFASGLVKSVGRWLMDVFPVNEYWMPFCTGLLFFIPFIGCVALLEKLPPPTTEDKLFRTERVQMDKAMRKQFLRTFFPGIALTVVLYTLLTIIRDIRDNFEVEIWEKLHVNGSSIYAKVDGIISFIILVFMSLLILVKDNQKAFKIIHIKILFGFLIAGFSTYLFHLEKIDGTTWMLLVGLGLYMAYIPYNAIFFERLIATFQIRGNIGFIMYIADSIGYLGSFMILLNKELLPDSVSWGDYFIQLVFWASIGGTILSALSYRYFGRKKKHTILAETVQWSANEDQLKTGLLKNTY